MYKINGERMMVFALDAENIQHLIQGYVLPLGEKGSVGIICDTKAVTSAEILTAVQVGVALREKHLRDKERAKVLGPYKEKNDE